MRRAEGAMKTIIEPFRIKVVSAPKTLRHFTAHFREV